MAHCWHPDGHDFCCQCLYVWPLNPIPQAISAFSTTASKAIWSHRTQYLPKSSPSTVFPHKLHLVLTISHLRCCRLLGRLSRESLSRPSHSSAILGISYLSASAHFHDSPMCRIKSILRQHRKIQIAWGYGLIETGTGSFI